MAAGSVAASAVLSLVRFSPNSFSLVAAATSLWLLFALYGFVLGLLPTLLYGAPLYALARRAERCSYLVAGVIGAAPGLVLLAYTGDWIILAYGSLTGLATHFFAKPRRPKTRMGSNNSFKPKPLRGSA
jgi:predicted cobalt transporter CbtA